MDARILRVVRAVGAAQAVGRYPGKIRLGFFLLRQIGEPSNAPIYVHTNGASAAPSEVETSEASVGVDRRSADNARMRSELSGRLRTLASDANARGLRPLAIALFDAESSLLRSDCNRGLERLRAADVALHGVGDADVADLSDALSACTSRAAAMCGDAKPPPRANPADRP